MSYYKEEFQAEREQFRLDRENYDERLAFIEEEQLGEGMKTPCPTQQPLGFGKYGKKTFDEVLEKDPSYLLWAHKNTDFVLTPANAKKVQDAIATNRIERIYQNMQSDVELREHLTKELGAKDAARLLRTDREIGKEIAYKKKGYHYKAKVGKSSPVKIDRLTGKEKIHPLFGGSAA